MFFRIGSYANAERGAVVLLETADGRHQFVGVCKAGRIRRETLFSRKRVAAQGHHIFDAHELEILQQHFRLVCGCAAADQMRDHFHVVVRLDGRADRHGAYAAADDAAPVTAVGLRLVADFVAGRGHVDVPRSEFHQRRDAGEEFILADPGRRRDDFDGREGGGPVPEHFSDFHSRWERKSCACPSEKPRRAA